MTDDGPMFVVKSLRLTRATDTKLQRLAEQRQILDRLGKPNASEVARRLIARGLASLKDGEEL